MNPKREVKSDPRRALPAADRLIRALAEPHAELPAWAAAEGARRALAAAREVLSRSSGADQPAPSEADLLERAGELARRLAAPHPAPVVNATGIVLHTNLGRSPLALGAAAAVAAAAGYCDLELDLPSGRRGQRMAALAEKLALLSGAEAALAVNNNAAALVLALDTLARGREVVVSRGELVEIGGSFRVPEIVEHAGVRLVEVGTTNRTHLADYERAIGPQTALLLKVHCSNFEQLGFVAEVALPELVSLGRARGLPVVEDLGSGTLLDLSAYGFPPEADARTRLRLGADVVCFSGDKLLGGPQAGIVLGRGEHLAAMARNPLARALRLDKLSLAALDWTLAAILDGRAEDELPTLRALLTSLPQLEVRAQALAERLAKAAGESARVAVESERAFVGGGSLPGFELDTWAVVLSPPDELEPGAWAERLASRLRRAATPVLGRVRDDRVILDVRTLLPGDDTRVEAAFAEALGATPR
jgi:L-seryl-tRNA(Ser) seleniumtransferase